jgi:hypothetical protein
LKCREGIKHPRHGNNVRSCPTYGLSVKKQIRMKPAQNTYRNVGKRRETRGKRTGKKCENFTQDKRAPECKPEQNTTKPASKVAGHCGKAHATNGTFKEAMALRLDRCSFSGAMSPRILTVTRPTWRPLHFQARCSSGFCLVALANVQQAREVGHGQSGGCRSAAAVSFWCCSIRSRTSRRAAMGARLTSGHEGEH